MSRLYQEKHIVPLLDSADIVAGIDSDSFEMKGYHHASILISYMADYAGANPAIITPYCGLTVGAKEHIITHFSYSYTSGAVKAASADVFVAEADGTGALSIARATMVSRTLILEIEPLDLTSGHDWITIQLGAEADAGGCSIIAILYPRYAYQNTTCLA